MLNNQEKLSNIQSANERKSSDFRTKIGIYIKNELKGERLWSKWFLRWGCGEQKSSIPTEQ